MTTNCLTAAEMLGNEIAAGRCTRETALFVLEHEHGLEPTCAEMFLDHGPEIRARLYAAHLIHGALAHIVAATGRRGIHPGVAALLFAAFTRAVPHEYATAARIYSLR